jgi:penicillin-binding protein A
MSEQAKFQHKLQRLALVLSGGFLVVALALVYWGTVRAPSLSAREDNPRLVEAALRVERGRIVDVNDQPLAYTEIVGQRAQRIYPLRDSGPAVGYYSFRHGAAGAEEAYDAHLRGLPETGWAQFTRELLNRPLRGADVRLTLDAAQQQTATALLAGHTGAALVMSLPDGAIRALASAPGYDPNQLDADFERLTSDEGAPLLNRATQGQYQPGLALYPLLLAAALDAGFIGLEQTAPDADQPVAINGHTLRCLADAPSALSWREAMQWGCPAPLLTLAARWGEMGVTAVFNQFAFNQAPDLRLATAAPTTAPAINAANAVLGQDALTITPLQLALAYAALANNGYLRQPHLTAARQDQDGIWRLSPPKADEAQPMTTTTARAILASLSAGDNIREHTAVALSGPEGSTLSWYIGFAPANAPRYLVVVALEQTADAETAVAIGRELLVRSQE